MSKSDVTPIDNKAVSSNVVWQQELVTRSDREQLNHHRACVVWFTGLSGSGKSTLAHAVGAKLHEQKVRTYILDGDNVRHGLCGDLGFSEQDRRENIRRIGQVATLFVDAGMLVLTAFISPFSHDRANVRALFAPEDFIEIYCQCSLDTCEARDVKGLYKKARAGSLTEFTGISSPYEAPSSPELVLNTDRNSLDDCVTQVLALLKSRGVVE